MASATGICDTQTMRDKVDIHRFTELTPTPSLLAGIDAVFFAASNTQNFASDAARAVFRERWLGRYLEHDPQFAYLAIAPGGEVAGYLVGSVSVPARASRFADIGYFQTFRDLTTLYPAHLHVNLAGPYRGHGLGGALIERFIADARQTGTPGVHVVTSRAARNVAFYARAGFVEAGAIGEGAAEIVFLARRI